eukprot:9474409-Pyramimonas_sp.AAC.1
MDSSGPNSSVYRCTFRPSTPGCNAHTSDGQWVKAARVAPRRNKWGFSSTKRLALSCAQARAC